MLIHLRFREHLVFRFQRKYQQLMPSQAWFPKKWSFPARLCSAILDFNGANHRKHVITTYISKLS